MKQIIIDSINAYEVKDIFSFFGHLATFSLYKNVICFWDEDEDTRVFEAVDIIQECYGKKFLVAIYEHEGCVSLYLSEPFLEFATVATPSHGLDLEKGTDNWTVTTNFDK